MRLRPRNHRIWPFLISISAWSISSAPSVICSSWISSFVTPCPASFRNFRWWVGMEVMSWGAHRSHDQDQTLFLLLHGQKHVYASSCRLHQDLSEHELIELRVTEANIYPFSLFSFLKTYPKLNIHLLRFIGRHYFLITIGVDQWECPFSVSELWLDKLYKNLWFFQKPFLLQYAD